MKDQIDLAALACWMVAMGEAVRGRVKRTSLDIEDRAIAYAQKNCRQEVVVRMPEAKAWFNLEEFCS